MNKDRYSDQELIDLNMLEVAPDGHLRTPYDTLLARLRGCQAACSDFRDIINSDKEQIIKLQDRLFKLEDLNRKSPNQEVYPQT